VRPILEYTCTIWPAHGQTDIRSVESVQRRVAIFTLNRYDKYQSVTSMLDELDWPTLQTRRNQLKLMMLFKITHGLVHVQNSLPLTYSSPDKILRGHTLQVYPACNQGWLLQSLILPLDHQFVEHFTPISG